MNNVIVRTLCAIAGLLCAGIGIIGNVCSCTPYHPSSSFSRVSFCPFIQAPQHVAARNKSMEDLREPLLDQAGNSWSNQSAHTYCFWNGYAYQRICRKGYSRNKFCSLVCFRAGNAFAVVLNVCANSDRKEYSLIPFSPVNTKCCE